MAFAQQITVSLAAAQSKRPTILVVYLSVARHILLFMLKNMSVSHERR